MFTLLPISLRLVTHKKKNVSNKESCGAIQSGWMCSCFDSNVALFK